MLIEALLHDHEAVPDGGGDGGGAPAPDPQPDTGGGDAPAPQPDPTPAPADYVSRDDYQALVDELAQIRGQIPQQQAAQPQPDQNFDPNEFLNPYNENFGANLLAVLGQVAQQQQQAVAPILDSYQQQQEVEQTQRVTAPILQADSAQHGDLTPEQTTVWQTLADSFLPQHEARFGEGSDRAIAAAAQQALQMVRAIAANAAQAGGQQAVDDLHTVTQTQTLPGTSTSAVRLPTPRIGETFMQRRARGAA